MWSTCRSRDAARAALALTLTGACTGAAAQSVEAGAAAYDLHCASCHGRSAVTTSAARDLRARVRYDFGTFRGNVRSGRPPRPGEPLVMPAFGASELADGQVCSIYLYLQSLQTRPVPDPAGICLPPPPPPAPPPPAPPPPPSLPAPPTADDVLASRANFFPVPGSERASLACEGGDVRWFTGSSPRDPARQWGVSVRFALSFGRDYRPGQCLWVGPLPARWARPGAVRPSHVLLEWAVKPLRALPFADLGFVHGASGVRTRVDAGEGRGSGASSLGAVLGALGNRDAIILFGGAVGSTTAAGELRIGVDEAAATETPVKTPTR